jgi:hypothetical protein
MKPLLFIVLSVAMIGEARADIFEPKMADICRPAPTPTATGRIQPERLIDKLLADPNVAVSFDDLPGTITFERKVTAVLAGPDYCAKASQDCPEDPKAREATNKKLATAQIFLLSYFQRHQNPVRLNEGGYQFTFEQTTQNIRAFFLTPNSPLVPACLAGQTAAGTPTPPVAEDKGRTSGRLIVRKSVTDLRVAQDSNAFKALQRASFSINDDMMQSSRTYAIQGVVGYGTGQVPISGWPGAVGEAIPFFSYTRQFVDGKNPNKISNVDNIGVGLLGDLLFPEFGLQGDFPLTRGIYNGLQFSSQLVHSNRSDTSVLSGKLTYTPYVNPLVVPGIATTERIGDFLVMLTPQAVFVYGDVLNNGNNAVLSQTGTFWRPGVHVEFSAKADTGAVAGIGFSTSYDYQKSYGNGPISNISLFSSTLSYTLPKQEYWSVQLTYADGRNLDTLERQRLLTLGVGLKY